MRHSLLLLAGLAGLPSLSSAQTAPGSHFYLGLGAMVLTDAPFAASTSTNFVGPALTAGVQLSPRWALQIGAGLGWYNNTVSNSYSLVSGQPPVTYTYDYHMHILSVPLLARYAFTNPARRFQVEALGGITVLRSSTHYTLTTNVPGQGGDSSPAAVTTGNASLGPAVRYVLSPQVALFAEAPVNAVLGGTISRFSDRLSLTAQLGARYTFGQ